MGNEIDELRQEVRKLNSKMEGLADKGLMAWASKSYSSWIMLGVLVGLPLIGVVVGYNLK